MISGEKKLQIPLLENGDRLTRFEFERRYNNMPRQMKAELIEGKVYMASPVRLQNHGQPHGYLVTWLGVYCAATLGVDLADNATVRLDSENELQPDGLLRIDSDLGGQSWISEDDYIEGAPELIVEVASSSAAYDLHEKFNVYRRNGVQEYIVWQVYDEKLDWFSLQRGEYLPLIPDDLGVIPSKIFLGLNLSVRDLLSGNLQGVLVELQKGLDSDDHKSFVDSLKG